jgi:hypothetical protein
MKTHRFRCGGGTVHASDAHDCFAERACARQNARNELAADPSGSVPPMRRFVPLLSAVFAFSTSLVVAAETGTPPAAPGGPDPREIPVPPIRTAFPEQPGPGRLPSSPELPEVLVRRDGSRVTSAHEWPARRAEILDTLEYYAVGHAPPAPDNVKGREVSARTVAGGKVKYRLIHLTFGPGDKLSLDIGLFTPAGDGPFPAVIAPAGSPPGATALPRLPNGPTQGRGTDVLLVVGSEAAEERGGDKAPKAARKAPTPADAEKIAAENVPLSRGYAYVMFNYNDCGEDTTLRNRDGSWAFRTTRWFPAYPEYDWGLLRAWAWGVSRIVDYLETDPAIDRSKLIVTGVSRTGKSAMVAAAFDERLALGAPVVTGGGGVGAYRLAGPNSSETLDIMERKYPNWFSPHLHAFWGHVDKLPFDEHWFLAACAPRPFIALEGTSDVISYPPAVKASIEAAKPAYALFHAEDRLGVNYANHGHALTRDDWNAMLDFADQHLLGRPASRRFDQFPQMTAR